MKRTILIVDDNAVERTVLYGFFKEEYNLLLASSGQEAISIIKSKFKLISAIVLDIVMPEMDGYEVMKEVRENAVLTQIPIVVSTALDDEETREKAIAYGANGFVTKPFNQTILIYTVQNAIRLREAAAMVNTLWRDRLTGLLNPDSFFKEAGQIIKRYEPGYFILSCFNIDNFKLINDLYGTEMGDRLLRYIADCMNQFAEKIHGLTCRYAADRFAVLYPAEMKNSAEVLENHVKTTTPEFINRNIRIRIGRYKVDDLNMAVSTMYDRATLAENSIRGRYDTYIAEYHESMMASLVREQQIVNGMAEAIGNRQFEIWFQPQYNHATSAMVGAEALVRWRKDGTLIPPNEFIPIFERNGLIYELDRFVWRQVCRALRKWIDEGREPLPVSVNVSRYDIFQSDFFDVISGLIDEYNLSVDLLRLEVTESAFSDSANVIVDKVDKLIELGFTVEIDDFGSGYSSLNTLKDVPASILKLDMRFFENTDNSQRSGNIVESVVRMAKWLGMAVIAEGVEDIEQADYLLSIGCYYIQGYYYSKPVPQGEYEEMFTKGKVEPKLTRLKTLETLNNNEFWNPRSMETLIFNSYVGGACIFEFHNKKTELLRINKQYIKELGGLVEENVTLKESSIVRFLDDENKNIAEKTVKEAIESKSEAVCELRLSHAAHTEYVRITVREIAGTGGRHLFYCVLLNMTQKHEAEKKQLEIAKRLENFMKDAQNAQERNKKNITALLTIMSVSDELMFAKDIEGRYICASKACAQAMGLDNAKTVIGKTDFELFDSKIAQLFRANDNSVISSRKPILNRSERLPMSDGSFKLVKTSEYPVLDSSGNVIGVCGIGRDVTKEHETIFEFATLLRVIPSGVLKYSADEKEEFEYINHNFILGLGYTEEQFKAKFHNCFNEMVWHEDRERAQQEIIKQEGDGEIGKFDYRIEAANGQLRWFHDEGVKVTDDQGKEWYYVTLIDITEQKEAEASLRLAEEEYRLATRHSGHTIGRYSIENQTLTITEDDATRLALPETIQNVPYGRVKNGKISSDTATAYIEFYENIKRGKKEGTVTFKKLLSNGWRWITERSTTIFDDDGKPVSAIISYVDVTNQQEKEAAYKKWQQALQNKNENTFTLLRCNLNKNSSYDSIEGTLLDFKAYDSEGDMTFNERTRFFADQIVVKEDRERYIAFVDADAMLASYYRGKRASSIEFCGRLTNSKVHWLRLSVELVEYPNSADVEAYLMYEDINDTKLAELQTKQQAETDPLTGLLNRKTFAQRLNNVIANQKKGAISALLLIDMDGFKQVNDSFGHSVGDQVLIDAGKTMRSIVHGRDLVCRLGGDEFIICLCDVKDSDAVMKKAEQICTLTRRSFSFGIQLSISIGIALCPNDADTFDMLYHKADKALYYVKENGKNSCAFYNKSMEVTRDTIRTENSNDLGEKRKILIADDNEINRMYLKNVFEDEFIVETAESGDKAMAYLSQHENEISIVLLDLMMPGMDGFAVLDKMQSDAKLRMIPVIVVSGIDDRETNLRAIRCGAFDFVTKPVDAELLRIRMQTAISRMENEQYLLKSRYIAMQHSEMQKYRSVLEDSDTIVIEYNIEKKTFMYDKSAENLAGTFDDRSLIDILKNDNIASEETVEVLKNMLSTLSDENARKSLKTTAKLRMKNGDAHLFVIRLVKCTEKPFCGRELLWVLTDIESA